MFGLAGHDWKNRMRLCCVVSLNVRLQWLAALRDSMLHMHKRPAGDIKFWLSRQDWKNRFEIVLRDCVCEGCVHSEVITGHDATCTCAWWSDIEVSQG